MKLKVLVSQKKKPNDNKVDARVENKNNAAMYQIDEDVSDL